MFTKTNLRIIIVLLAIGAAIVTVAFMSLSVPTGAAYHNPSPAWAFHGRGGGGAVENSNLAPISANPVAAHSVYMSEQSLRSSLDDAYEKHQATRVQTLLRILNGRYERRVNLPY